jgi:hypothetical protein
MKSLFNFKSFIEGLRKKEDKRQIVEKYELLYGSIPDDVKECEFYNRYLQYLKTVPYQVPLCLKNRFDFDMLLRLVSGSFSSQYKLTEFDDGTNPELFITVISGEQKVKKSVSELFVPQIVRLYGIYLEEQINLSILVYGEIPNPEEDENDDDNFEYEENNVFSEQLDLDDIFIRKKDENSLIEDVFVNKKDAEPSSKSCKDENRFHSYEDYLKIYTDYPAKDCDTICERYKKMKENHFITYPFTQRDVLNEIIITEHLSSKKKHIKSSQK